MKKNETNKYFLAKASLIIIGGLFVLGLNVKAGSIVWHWPFGRISASAVVVNKPAIHEHLSEADVDAKDESHASLNLKPSAKAVFVPVLMYHHVADMTPHDRIHDSMRSDLTVGPSDFEQQVKYFYDSGYHTIHVQDLYDAMTNGINLPALPIIFTFDDGYKDVFENAIPVLKKYGYTGTFAIATELLGRPSYGAWDDVVNAEGQGMEIISHTENHLDLTSPKYSEDDLTREIFGSKQILEQKLGHAVDFFVYPYGHTNDHVSSLVTKAGYKMAFTTQFGVWMDPSVLVSEPRLRVHGFDGLEKLKKVLGPVPRTLGVQTNP